LKGFYRGNFTLQELRENIGTANWKTLAGACSD